MARDLAPHPSPRETRSPGERETAVMWFITRELARANMGGSYEIRPVAQLDAGGLPA